MSIVRDTRNRLGLTQGELAERLGVTQSTVSRLENCDKPDERTLLALDGLIYRKILHYAPVAATDDAIPSDVASRAETGNGIGFSAAQQGATA
jgi:transcriptional regulator with XRE-family HTH domain